MSALTEEKKTVWAKIGMFVATIIWGGSFLVVKTTVDVLPPNIMLAFRFSIALAILCIIFHKRLKNIDKGYLKAGGIIGVFLFCAYCFQTLGIQTTTPGKNAFLTAVYCVIVPFLFWMVSKKRPDRYNIIAAFVCITGIGLVSLTGSFTIEKGDALTLVGGFFYACQIVAIAKYAGNRDPILLTIIQFGVTAALSWCVGLISEPFPAVAGWTQQAIGGVLFLAVFPTCIGLLLQNVGQKYTSASAASIILSLEAVFGVVFSVIFYGEQLTTRLVVGFALIFFAILVSETKLSFLKIKKRAEAGKGAPRIALDLDEAE